MKLSDYVADFVASLGIHHVFIVAGGGAMHLDNSFGSHPEIQIVCNLHEQASAIAAEAYSKKTNNLGVALVTTGPGGTNTITGVVGAWQDSTPCLFISGQVKKSDLTGNRGVRQFGFQEVDIVALVKTITKYAVTVMEPEEIRYHLEKAVFQAKNGRPGPVWIDIPLDVQAANIEPEQLIYFDEGEIKHNDSDNSSLKENVSKIIELLEKSERPIIWGGNGIRLAHAEVDFFHLIQSLQIPVLLTWLGIDLLPESHPLFAGRPGSVAPRGANFSLQNSDLLITIGARLDMGSTGYSHKKLAREAKKVMVDIDPNEISKMQTNIDLPICSDAGDFCREFSRQVDGLNIRNRASWLDTCLNWKKKYPVVTKDYYHQKKVNTYIFTDTLSILTSEDEVIITGSSGAGIEIFLLSYKVKPGQRLIHTASLGAMGFGLPASIGTCLASNSRQVILVDADGGFQLNSQELETIHRLDLPIKIFILNNQGYSSIRISQQKYFGKLTGADLSSGLSLPNNGKLAAAYNIPYLKLEDTFQLTDMIKEVLEHQGPIICDVMIPTDEPRIPSLATVQSSDGRMVSKPMEDLCPFLDRAEFESNMIIPIIED